MRTFSYSALREKRWYPEMESLAGSVSAAARRTEPLLQEKGDDLQALARAARLKNIGSIIFSVWLGTQTSAFSDLKIA